MAVYELTQSEHEHEPRLNQLSKWERGYQINQIRIQDNFIFTSDALRSVDVLQWINGKLKLFARDHSSLWPITVSLLGEKEVLVAEVSPIGFCMDDQRLSDVVFIRARGTSILIR